MMQYSIDSEEYYAVKLSADSIPDLVYLFKHCFNETITVAELNSRHSLCHGETKYVGFIAYQKGTNDVAAYYGVFPTYLSYKGETQLSAQSGDTMTHPKHQKKGLFVKLATLTYTYCADNGISLIFGFPNENSYPGFTQKLGFSLPPAMGAFTLVENKFELARFTEKLPFLHKIHLAYAGFVLKLFSNKGSSFPSSNTALPNLVGVFRDETYFQLKSLKPTQIRQVKGKNLWIQVFSNRMLIGDLEAGTKADATRVIQKLRLIAFLSGLRFVSFKLTPNAFWFQALHDLGFVFREINPVILKNLSSNLPFEQIAFTNSDMDVF